MEQTQQDTRITQRLELIELLAEPYWRPLQLIRLAWDNKEPTIVDLDFSATHLQGMYIYQIVEMLKSLQDAGLVALQQDRSGRTGYSIDIKDEIDKRFLDELFR